MMDFLKGVSSETVLVVGIVLLVLGGILIGVGVVGAVLSTVKEWRSTPEATGEGTIEALTKLASAATEFLKVLITTPRWLVSLGFGVGLVYMGGRLVGTW